MRFASPFRNDPGTSRGPREALTSTSNGKAFLVSPRKGAKTESDEKGLLSARRVPSLPISAIKDEKENVGFLSARSLKGQSAEAPISEGMLHSARTLSPQRRTRLQRMLEKEGLKEALSTLLQATSPRKKWDSALVEEQVEKLMGNHPEPLLQDHSLNASPGKARPNAEAQQSPAAEAFEAKPLQKSPMRARPATAAVSPSRRSGKDAQEQVDEARPLTAREGAQRRQTEAECPEESAAGGGSISPRKIPRPRPATAGGASGEPVQLMPTYTVAGKRMPLIQLIREKIWQRSPGGANQLLKCFNQLDTDHSGSITANEMRKFLTTFHVDLDPQTLHTFVAALDANKDGNIDYQEFVEKLLPEDFPNQGGMGRFGGGAENYLVSQLNMARAMESQRHVATKHWQARMNVDDLERLIREKLESRVLGGPSHLRKAFRYMDRNGDGKLSRQEFQLMLRTFNISPSSEEYAALLARYDPNNDGDIDYYEFVDKLMPPEFETRKQMVQRKAAKLQAEYSKRLEAYEQALRSDGSDRLRLEDVRQACERHSLPLDDEIVQHVAATCRDSGDSKMDVREVLQKLRQASDARVHRESLRAPRDLMSGFGNPADAPSPASTRADEGSLTHGKRPMTMSHVVTMFSEKVAGRFRGRGPLEDMRLAFTRFDVSGRGKLDYADVSRAFQNFNMRLTPGQKQELLAKLDPEKTGFVTFNSFYSVLGSPPEGAFFPAPRKAPFVPLQKSGRPFTATPRVTNVVMEVWKPRESQPVKGADDAVASPRGRLTMTPRGSRPPSSSQGSVNGGRPATTSSQSGGTNGDYKSTRQSTRSPYAAESPLGATSRLPNLASRPSTAASAAKPQNFDFGTLTPR